MTTPFLQSGLHRAAAVLVASAIAGATAARAQTPDMDACGQGTQAAARILACTNIIGTASNPPALVAWAYANRCQAQETAQQYDAAIADCSESLRLDPDNARVLNLRGFAYFAKGDADSALADYGSVLRLDPTNAYAHSAMGNVFLGRHDYGRAIEEFNAALKLKPSDAFALAGRGYAYARQGDTAKALQDLDAAVGLDPNAYLARLRLAEVLALTDDADRAQSLDQETLRLFPKQAQAIYRERCFHQAILGSTTPAIADFNRALQLQPRDGLALSYRGYAHLRAGQIDEAIADYTAAIDFNSRDASSFFGRSAAHASRAEIAAASRDIAAARAIDPKIDAEMSRLHVVAPPGLANTALPATDTGTAPAEAVPAQPAAAPASEAPAGSDEDKALCGGKKQA